MHKKVRCLLLSIGISVFFIMSKMTCTVYATSNESFGDLKYIEENDVEDFTWDNAIVYFAITDRFCNGNGTNDHSYGRSVGEVDADLYETRQGTFHGGDISGLTQKIEEGYFDILGINVLWITAPYEQMHGAICGDGFKYYAYHGYYPLDFTQMDKNMGTEEEFKTFVDVAHRHGIRVVIDVVMNHVGYADPITVQEYDFGEVTENFEEIYYNTSEKEYNWTMDYSSVNEKEYATLNSEADWENWWGTKWVRAVTGRYKGYTGSQSDTNYRLCLGGLPDIKTESTVDNGIPKILQTKWKKEGRLETESEELDNFFKETGLERRNVNYIVKWLTDWVRKYGIDGFRCDSVKHVELEHWDTLKKQADKALKEWRINNPENVAANWDEDFWMVGENFDFGNKKDNHFYYGFDSMVNLQFQGKENSRGCSIDNTYKTYAQLINTDQDFNMLTYISSHDMGLGTRSKNACNMLLMCPGGVQIYYGDESGRSTGGISGEQGWRSHMNWDTIDEDLLKHFQKVSSFRKKHPAIAAGEHKKLQNTPYSFSRTLKNNEGTDKVVISMPVKEGKTEVNVEGVFDEGEIIRDFYTEKKYQVVAGTITAECDNGKIILLERTGERKESIGARTAYASLPFQGENVELILYSYGVTNAMYQVNNQSWKLYENGEHVTVGGGMAYGESVSVKLSAEKQNGEKTVKEYIYEKAEPEKPEDEFIISVLKTDFDEAPYCYVYDTYNIYSDSYPGTTMKDDGEYYSFRYRNLNNAYFIISTKNQDYRSTSDGEPGILCNGQKIYSKDTKEVKERPLDKQGRVFVHYVTQDGVNIKSVYRTGRVGETYKTSKAALKGYTYIYASTNTTGIYTEEDIDVYYYYKENSIETNIEYSENMVVISVDNSKLADGVRYMFSYMDDSGKECLIRNFSKESTIEWPLTKLAGKSVTIYVILNGEIRKSKIII